MDRNSKKSALLNIIGFVLAITLLTAIITAAVLLYKDRLDAETYSNWLFYAALIYIALAVVPLYDVLTSSNSVSITYGEFAVKGRLDNQGRINDMLSRKNYRFSIIMAMAGLILFAGAFIVERLF